MFDRDVRCKVWFEICDEDVQCDFINVRCDMYNLLWVEVCVVWYYNTLCAMNWVFLKYL